MPLEQWQLKMAVTLLSIEIVEVLIQQSRIADTFHTQISQFLLFHSQCFELFHHFLRVMKVKIFLFPLNIANIFQFLSVVSTDHLFSVCLHVDYLCSFATFILKLFLFATSNQLFIALGTLF